MRTSAELNSLPCKIPYSAECQKVTSVNTVSVTPRLAKNRPKKDAKLSRPAYSFFGDIIVVVCTFLEVRALSAEVGKVTLKSNGDEALNDVSPQKVTAMKHLMLRKNCSHEAMKRLMLLKN